MFRSCRSRWAPHLRTSEWAAPRHLMVAVTAAGTLRGQRVGQKSAGAAKSQPGAIVERHVLGGGARVKVLDGGRRRSGEAAFGTKARIHAYCLDYKRRTRCCRFRSWHSQRSVVHCTMFLSNITLHAHVSGSTTANAKLKAWFIFAIAFFRSKVRTLVTRWNRPARMTSLISDMRSTGHCKGIPRGRGRQRQISGLPPEDYVARQSRR